jgi:hypothetical protein
VYEAVRTLIALAVTNGTVRKEEWSKFARDTREVAFLFKNKKIEAYCTELYKRAVNVSPAGKDVIRWRFFLLGRKNP